MHVPVLRSLFGPRPTTINQTDIVMLLTPHIVRTHELTAEDLAPIYIGTQQNVGLSGPPPLIAPVPNEEPARSRQRRLPALRPADSRSAAARTCAAAGRRRRQACRRPTRRRRQERRRCRTSRRRRRRRWQSGGSGAGRTARGHAAAGDRRAVATAATVVPSPVDPNTPVAPPTGPPRDVTQTAPNAPPGSPVAPSTQVIVTAPPEMRVASGPSTVPLSVNNASRLSTMTLTVTFNPTVLRVRTVQEGTFMRQGGVTATFTPRIDAVAGRVDIAITRSGDQAGASGTGLLAALHVRRGRARATRRSPVSGVASSPEGSPVALQFTPVTVTVR